MNHRPGRGRKPGCNQIDADILDIHVISIDAAKHGSNINNRYYEVVYGIIDEERTAPG